MSSPRGQELLQYLPGYYSRIKEFQQLYDSEGVEFDDLVEATNSNLDQIFVDTATWGLSRWEKELAIKPPAGQPFEQRRSTIRSKMRGTGMITIKLIRSVAEAFHGGEIDVSTHPELYRVTIKFIDSVGIPPNLDDLKNVLRDIIPAHLDVVYTFSYLLINEIHGMVTLSDLEAIPLKKFAGGA
ncbi:DUF2313 domain-containing protein [Paenibacillus sp. NEAU-GSW1]|nr:DUF2313 domain-containing protein [Paenibacillus sp. NEAU-GSW1]